MKKKVNCRSIVLLAAFILPRVVFAQTVVLATRDGGGGGYVYGQPYAITFNIENTNDSPYILKNVEMTLDNANNYSGMTARLWYSANYLAGPTTLTETDPGWTVITTGQPLTINQYGYYSLFGNLDFIIPPYTEYRFAVETSKGFRYDPYDSSGVEIFSAGGIIFKVGAAVTPNNPIDYVGYLGPTPDIQYGPFYYGGRITLEPASTAPVTLLNLTAAYNKNSHSNIINWQTAQEINSSHFVLQKSYNPPHFTTVATIPAAGNSSIQKNYSYTDNAIQYKPTYYRLQQTDKDGRYTYSKTVQVNPVKNNAITIYPNPANNSLTVQYMGKSGITSLVITDMLGRQVQKNILSSTQGYNQSFINTVSLSPGTYIVTLQNDEQVLQSRFVKAQ